ncbi:UNKNOWN [Stylonychia lemnae]|uniref:Uncharacterized protein n=1 Tax=Stylonychia lemnae TaxID=5949 RepID=A0A078A3U3_STYLE|nr:UNKNOWN [Stylonychia lemnae]|eukprot:CDW75424.1 UNKNOWN [Stylonychia lemnae]
MLDDYNQLSVQFDSHRQTFGNSKISQNPFVDPVQFSPSDRITNLRLPQFTNFSPSKTLSPNKQLRGESEAQPIPDSLSQTIDENFTSFSSLPKELSELDKQIIIQHKDLRSLLQTRNNILPKYSSQVVPNKNGGVTNKSEKQRKSKSKSKIVKFQTNNQSSNKNNESSLQTSGNLRMSIVNNSTKDLVLNKIDNLITQNTLSITKLNRVKQNTQYDVDRMKLKQSELYSNINYYEKQNTTLEADLKSFFEKQQLMQLQVDEMLFEIKKVKMEQLDQSRMNEAQTQSYQDEIKNIYEYKCDKQSNQLQNDRKVRDKLQQQYQQDENTLKNQNVELETQRDMLQQLVNQQNVMEQKRKGIVNDKGRMFKAIVKN